MCGLMLHNQLVSLMPQVPARRNPTRRHLQASFPLDSTFGGDTLGNFSSGFCPQCSHFAQRRDNYDGLLSERVQTMHTILTDLGFKICRKEERGIMRRKSAEGLSTIDMATPCTLRQHFEVKSYRKIARGCEDRVTQQWQDIVTLAYLALQDNKKNKFKTKNTVNTGQCDTVANDLNSYHRRSVKVDIVTPLQFTRAFPVVMQ